jgi:hypothetical protein
MAEPGEPCVGEGKKSLAASLSNSVFGWPLDLVNNCNLERRSSSFQPESELLLHCGYGQVRIAFRNPGLSAVGASGRGKLHWVKSKVKKS